MQFMREEDTPYVEPFNGLDSILLRLWTGAKIEIRNTAEFDTFAIPVVVNQTPSQLIKSQSVDVTVHRIPYLQVKKTEYWNRK